MLEKKVILITGASSGIGLSCAKQLSKSGHIVYGTSRKAPFPAEKSNGYFLIRMDVTDEDSIKKAVSFILGKEGKIDVLINNAGYGLAGPVEATTSEEAFSQFNTNFFGLHRVIRAVLPAMRKQKSGLIINISSIAGIIGVPFQPFYSASKFAVEGLSEALFHEVKPFGIKVVLVEPGDLKTEFTNNRVYVKEALASDYQGIFQKAISVAEKDEQSGSSPEAVAALIEKIIFSSNPRFRYTVGPAYEKLAVFLKKILPEKVFLWAIGKYYRIY